jgi:hypothetical protein
MSLLEPVVGMAVNAILLVLAAILSGFAAEHPIATVIGTAALSPILAAAELSILIAINDAIDNRQRSERAE